MTIKQIITLLLLMIFTTSVVNAHALSHLFEDDFDAIEHCDVCDDFVQTSQEDHFVILNPVQEVTTPVIFISASSTSIPDVDSFATADEHSGKYYNKPPPFLN